MRSKSTTRIASEIAEWKLQEINENRFVSKNAFRMKATCRNKKRARHIQLCLAINKKIGSVKNFKEIKK